MGQPEKEKLMYEIQMQQAALRQIGKWKTTALAISALGVAAAYAGLTGSSGNLVLSISGVAAIIAGIVAALVLNLGIRNGMRNVDKMLCLLEQKKL